MHSRCSGPLTKFWEQAWLDTLNLGILQWVSDTSKHLVSEVESQACSQMPSNAARPALCPPRRLQVVWVCRGSVGAGHVCHPRFLGGQLPNFLHLLPGLRATSAQVELCPG